MEYDCDVDRLISLVQDRRALYDYNLREHSNKKIIEKLWKEISDELGAPVAECKTKWHSLRNSYARALRDEKSMDLGIRKRKKWYMTDSLTFLSGFMNPRAKRLENADEDSLETISGTPESVEVDVEVGDVWGWDTKSKNIEKCCAPKFLETKQTKSTNTNFPVYYLKAEEFEDPDLNFFKSLLPDFKKFSGKRKRHFKEMTLISLNHLMDEEEAEKEDFIERIPKCEKESN